MKYSTRFVVSFGSVSDNVERCQVLRVLDVFVPNLFVGNPVSFDGLIYYRIENILITIKDDVVDTLVCLSA